MKFNFHTHVKSSLNLVVKQDLKNSEFPVIDVNCLFHTYSEWQWGLDKVPHFLHHQLASLLIFTRPSKKTITLDSFSFLF